MTAAFIVNRERETLARYGVRIVQRPATEAVSLEDCRAHLRLTATGSPLSHPDDYWITNIGLPAAREWCENYTGRAFASQTIELAINGFPATADAWYAALGMSLPFSPVQYIESVTYIDSDGASQLVDPTVYALDSFQEPGMLFSAYGQTWPTTRGMRGAVRVRYRAGYTVPGESPDDFPLPYALKAAVLLLLAHWHENREPMVTGTIATELKFTLISLLGPYVIRYGIA